LHPDSDISASGYYYPIGRQPRLCRACKRAGPPCGGQQGKIADFGTQAGLTYLPCRELAVLGNIWEKIFQK
jgi:hypothetical protein